MLNHNQKIGYYGEGLAVKYLKNKGYKILERNKRIGHKEIDIIAKNKGEIIFIEVKTRLSFKFGGAQDALTPQKIKLFKSALYYYGKQLKMDLENLRIDFIAIDLNKNKKIANINHYKDIT